MTIENWFSLHIHNDSYGAKLLFLRVYIAKKIMI